MGWVMIRYFRNYRNNLASPLFLTLYLALGDMSHGQIDEFSQIPPREEKAAVPAGKEETAEKDKKAKERSKSKEATMESQLSVGAIDREGEWIFEFERQFAIRKEKPVMEFYWGFNMLQEFHGYDNADLRKVNSTNDFQIRTSDDAQGLALTRAKFDTQFLFPEHRVGMELSFGFDGVWGSFQLQGNGNPGTRIARANIFWEFFNKGGFSSDLVIGRQFFSIGGIPNDYMLRDVLDALVVNVHQKDLIDIKILAVDVYSGANSFGAGENDRWNDEFQYFSRHEEGKMAGLRGDVSTYRTGIVLSAMPFFRKKIKSRLDPRLYTIYARVRGNKGGADNSENGRIGNYSDNDWSLIAGSRISYRFDDIMPIFRQWIVYADFGYSQGQDLKRQGEPRADYKKLAYGAGTILQTKAFGIISPLVEADFFYAQGAEFDENGNMTSHGFIGMRGDRVGGTLLRRYWGVRPSGYVNYNGIDDTPFDANRKAGAMLLHAALGAELWGQLVAKLDWWYLKDTSTTKVNFNEQNLDLILNPWKSRAEIEAQQKLGKDLGHEVNFTLQYFPNPLLMFQITASYFVPGSFYKKPIEDVVSRNGVPKGGPADANFTGIFLRSTIAF
ncbi:MAG: hypothetical protein RML34_02535 [Leptospiraceae bacterium]|nr:hypothetical protein [Leptospiraceae bacterium]